MPKKFKFYTIERDSKHKGYTDVFFIEDEKIGPRIHFKSKGAAQRVINKYKLHDCRVVEWK
ncbi:MAG: hypothetical protein JSS91_00705 [Bacteroidetes bacterium]|nr:hypothetical protein [Bacteroidota bacterium]